MRSMFLALLAVGSVANADDPPATEAPAVEVNEDGVVPWLAEAPMGEGHCIATEPVAFSCEVKGGKVLSLCGSVDGSSVQYRFGPKGSPELVFPEDGDRSRFQYEKVTWMRGVSHTVSFSREGYTYRVKKTLAGGYDGAANNLEGVAVVQGEKELAFLSCIEPAVGIGLGKIGEILPKAPADAE